MDPNEPATKADLRALREEIKGDLAGLRDELREFIRDAQTEILRGFERYSRGQDIPHAR